ncbi:MAG TPA: hypothetical protein VLL27_10095 [Solirubrobacterales bacterium]|nr:hypothetical protein [Solirubrobacterales bacterium]
MQANPRLRAPRDEEMAERAILALVLAVHPHYRTTPELSREFGGKRVVKRAVTNLVSYGLITTHGNTLLLTSPAFHCHRLDAW